MSFDGQPEFDMSRFGTYYGFSPRNVNDDILSIQTSAACASSLSFHRWEGNPALYQILYDNPNDCSFVLAGASSAFMHAGSGKAILEFGIEDVVHEGGVGGFSYGGFYEFEYRGSRLRAIRHSQGEGHFCAFVQQPEEDCVHRFGKLAESYVKSVATYVAEYEFHRQDQTYVAEPMRRKDDGSPEEVLESDRTEVRLGEGDKGWKIAMDDMKQVTELLAYARTQRPDDGETEKVKARCGLWKGNQLLEWKKPKGTAKKKTGAKAQEKTYDRFVDFLSDISFLYTGDERSIAVHWTGADNKPGFANLIGYYDGERQTCYSRFAETGDKTRKALDQGRYETLFNNRSKH